MTTPRFDSKFEELFLRDVPTTKTAAPMLINEPNQRIRMARMIKESDPFQKVR